MIECMKKTSSQYARALYSLTDGKSGDGLESAVKAFVEYIASSHNLHLWREIERSFNSILKEKHGVANVTIQTAYEMPTAHKQGIKEAFKNASVNINENPDLLGGAIITID